METSFSKHLVKSGCFWLETRFHFHLASGKLKALNFQTMFRTTNDMLGRMIDHFQKKSETHWSLLSCCFYAYSTTRNRILAVKVKKNSWFSIWNAALLTNITDRCPKNRYVYFIFCDWNCCINFFLVFFFDKVCVALHLAQMYYKQLIMCLTWQIICNQINHVWNAHSMADSLKNLR